MQHSAAQLKRGEAHLHVNDVEHVLWVGGDEGVVSGLRDL
jgi:hypothetical protein